MYIHSFLFICEKWKKLAESPLDETNFANKETEMRKSGYILSAALTLVLSVSPILSNVSFATPSTQTKVKQALAKYKAAQKEVQELQKKISTTDAKLNTSFQKLQEVQARQAETQKRLNQIMVRLYMSGQGSMEKQLLSAQSFSEFLGRLETIRLLMENDYQVISQYREQAEQISNNQTDIKKQESANGPLLKEAEKKLKQLQAQYKALKEQLRKEKIKASSVGVSDPGASTNGYWVNKARAMMGKVQYKFGAENYPYFDCSGWTQYVFRTYRGINLPRTAASQSSVGVPVTKLNLEPGDLVFFQGTYKSGVSHVGIYLGNGYYISNLNEANDLQIDPLNSSYSQKHWYGARRVH